MRVLAVMMALAAPLAVPAAVHGQAADAAASDRVVNDPRVEALQAYGSRIPPQVRGDKTVQFGKALRVPISSGGADFWRIGVITPVLKPVRAGDQIVIAFWARAQKTEDGVPGKIGRVQLEATPVIRTIFEKSFEIGPEWTLYKLSGKADRAYGPRELNAALHLASAKQVIDIGPVFVLDYGQ